MTRRTASSFAHYGYISITTIHRLAISTFCGTAGHPRVASLALAGNSPSDPIPPFLDKTLVHRKIRKSIDKPKFNSYNIKVNTQMP